MYWRVEVSRGSDPLLTRRYGVVSNMNHVQSDQASFGPAAGAMGGAPGRLDFGTIFSVMMGRWSVFLPVLLLGICGTVAALVMVKPVYTEIGRAHV